MRTARQQPYLLFALLTGAAGDRVRRRRVLITADLARALGLAVIVALALTQRLSILLLLGLAF